jgi:hypothetical protein
MCIYTHDKNAVMAGCVGGLVFFPNTRAYTCIVRRVRECFVNAESTIQSGKYAHHIREVDEFMQQVQLSEAASKTREEFERSLEKANESLLHAGTPW